VNAPREIWVGVAETFVRTGKRPAPPGGHDGLNPSERSSIVRTGLSGLLVATVVAALLTAGHAIAATGAKWTAAPPPPMPTIATGSVLQDVTVLSPNDVWAVGAWWDAVRHPLAVHWNGTAWSAVPTPDAPTTLDAYSLAAVDGIASGDVWAVGSVESHATEPPVTSPLVLHYDGSAWSVAPSPSGPAGSQSALADVDMRTADDGWAVGQTAEAGRAPQPLILRWQSGQWARVATPAIGITSRLTSVFAGSADDAWAVGTQIRQNDKQASLVLHWDGVSWTQVTVPDALGASGSEVLESVAAATSTEVWAVGSTCDKTSLVPCAPLVLHLSRGAWRVVPTAAGTGALTEVVPFSPTDVWVIGYASTQALSDSDHAEHWDGQRFTIDPTVPGAAPPMSSNGKPASALAAAAGDKASGVLWALGWFQDSAGRVPHVIYRG